jgi:hypothetical protein
MERLELLEQLGAAFLGLQVHGLLLCVKRTQRDKLRQPGG